MESDDKLARYSAQLEQVEAAIAADPDNAEWRALRDDLVEVIKLTRQLAHTNKVAAAATASKASSSAAAATSEQAANPTRTLKLGERCQALFELDGQWYNAKVAALTDEGYVVTYLGWGNTVKVGLVQVRPYRRPNTSGWSARTRVSAMHPADGSWREASVVEVRESHALVRFGGEREPTEVEIDLVRAMDAPAGGGDKGEFRVPEYLELHPEDSPEERERKKRQLKSLRHKDKLAHEEHESEERRSSWKSFASKNKKIKKPGALRHDPRFDATRAAK